MEELQRLQSACVAPPASLVELAATCSRWAAGIDWCAPSQEQGARAWDRLSCNSLVGLRENPPWCAAVLCCVVLCTAVRCCVLHQVRLRPLQPAATFN